MTTHKTKDLGTYHLRVELLDDWGLLNAHGWIEVWHTGWRYTNGTPEQTRLDATPIAPSWESEEELFKTMKFMYLEGNWSCDCNKVLFLARAYQQPEPQDPLCGQKMELRRLTVIRPDMSEIIIWP